MVTATWLMTDLPGKLWPDDARESARTQGLVRMCSEIRREAVERRRTMSPFYWERHPDGPFVTFIAVAATYLHPESDDLDSLKAFARREGDGEMRVFKSELREALKDPGQLPGDELFESVEYDDAATSVPASAVARAVRRRAAQGATRPVPPGPGIPGAGHSRTRGHGAAHQRVRPPPQAGTDGAGPPFCWRHGAAAASR